MNDPIRTAATLLADLRLRANGATAPLVELPADARPADLDAAYRVQHALAADLARRGPGAAVGWKIGCTTAVMQEYLNIRHPCAGTLYERRVYGDEIELRAEDYFRLGLECEIAVRLAADLPGDADRARADAALGAVMASVEIVEHRFEDFAGKTPSLVADDFFSAGCAFGREHDPAAAAELDALRGGFVIDGEAGETGDGAAILGHPLNALVWLAGHAARYGRPLRAGDRVTLGSVVKTVYPRPGQTVEARFERLSPVRVRVV